MLRVTTDRHGSGESGDDNLRPDIIRLDDAGAPVSNSAVALGPDDFAHARSPARPRLPSGVGHF